jgi:D-alanyl-D-alanine-carboxypeptidase/D-alanyl-D-alanine-endopeptidase
MTSKLLRTLVTSLAFAAPLAAQSIPDDVAANMRARVDQGSTVGVIVGVVDSSGTRYFAYGNTAMQGGSPVNEHTVFEIGSITKVFTALSLADMVVHQEASLDDPVKRYLPATAVVPSTPGHEITLRLLSAQRSGLPRMPSNFAPANPANPYADYSGMRLVAFLAGYTLTRDPGAQYEYSNLGQGLLGYALARHDNVPYEQMVTHRVLQPLGMRETMIALTSDARRRLALGHSGGQQVANWDLDAFAGAGALRSTAADMTRFLAAAMGLAHTSLDSAFALTYQVQGDAGSPQMDIGLAWHILKLGGGRIVWHNGGTGGYRSWAGFDPERKVGVVVLSNSSNGVDDIGLHLLAQTIPLLPQFAAIPMSADSLEAYVGTYQLAPTFQLAVTRQGDTLLTQATGQGIIRIWPRAANEFFLREVNAQLTFVRDSTGRVSSLVLHQGGRDIPAPRLP